MLSKKMTFSLMSLITLLAFAFAFVADDAFAAKKPFEITIVGRTTATYSALENDSDVTENEVTVDLIIESAQTIPTLAFPGNVKAIAIDEMVLSSLKVTDEDDIVDS